MVVVYLPKDAPKLEASIKGLVLRPHKSLHGKILPWVAVVVRALDLVSVPDIAVVGLGPLAWLEAVKEVIHKKLYHYTDQRGCVCLPRLNSLGEY